MGLFDLFKRTDINEGLSQYKSTPKAVLIDVREVDEYKLGHIPNSKNIPLSNIRKIENEVKDKSIPLFVYCLSGSRSGEATRMLVKMGYQAVTNIGGINGYKGKIEY